MEKVIHVLNRELEVFESQFKGKRGLIVESRRVD
jgi:hypothetical protein